MKSVSSDVIDVLAGRQFTKSDLYTFTLASGTVLRYTSGDTDITVGGNTWSCGGFTGAIIERSGSRGLCQWKTGLEVGTLQFDIIPRQATVLGIPFLSACRKGLFDGADFQLLRYVTDGTKSGTIPLFDGRVAEITAGRSVANFQIADHRELLNQSVPRSLYQSSCTHIFCDSGCTLNRASYTTTGSAASGSTAAIVNASLSGSTGDYDLGSITFTSGTNNGLTRSIKTYTHGSPSTVEVIAPFPDAPAPGDAFSIFRGCARTQAACSAYGNLSNFKAMPFIPEASTVT